MIIVIFSIWVPDTFPTWATAKQILNGNAVVAMLALSLLIPLSAGVFDLSTAYTATLAGVLLAKLVVAGVPLGLAVVISLGAALASACSTRSSWSSCESTRSSERSRRGR